MPVSAAQSMAHGVSREAVGLIPQAGPFVQEGGNAAHPDGVQPVPKQISEETVVAVPLPRLIEGDDEQIGI